MVDQRAPEDLPGNGAADAAADGVETLPVGHPDARVGGDDLVEQLARVLGSGRVRAGAALRDDAAEGHDECLTVAPGAPAAVVRPHDAAEVAAIVRVCAHLGVPITPRGSGTGLSGACVPADGAVVIAFDEMAEIREIDVANRLAVVQPGVTLAALDAALEPYGLCYPVYPGEYSASVGGNVATNAGGMRAVKHGVTRRHVLGLELVLATGETIRTGARSVKSSSGYDLTQLVIGSEGTLAIVTEVTIALVARPTAAATVLAPFATLDEVVAAIGEVLAQGATPAILEYIDLLTMDAMRRQRDLDLGIPPDVVAATLAYLMVVVEGDDPERLEADLAALAPILAEAGATDVYVLPASAARELIEAREQAFWVAKANGADDIVDVAVPRAALGVFTDATQRLAAEHSAFIGGCGHAGDGNVHLAIFQPDAEVRSRLLHEIFATAQSLGGVISGEHGIGRAKRPYFTALTDPVTLALMGRLKAAFDPQGLLNPGVIFE